MAGAKTGTNKGRGGRVRKYNGQIVKPCLYNGNAQGHGKYFAAMIGDQLVLDPTGKPYVFRECGQLVAE